MSDILFFIKIFCLTVALVIVMQIQVGERTVESHAMSWVQTSTVTAPLNQAARGGAKMIRDFSQTVHHAISKNGKKKKEEKASSSFRWSHTHSETSSKSDEEN